MPMFVDQAATEIGGGPRKLGHVVDAARPQERRIKVRKPCVGRENEDDAVMGVKAVKFAEKGAVVARRAVFLPVADAEVEVVKEDDARLVEVEKRGQVAIGAGPLVTLATD